jgi:uncharacterized protein (TIGR02270 family)
MTVRATYIRELHEHHLEELGFLWGRWRAALGDPDYTLAPVADLEERILAHLQGVQVPGDRALPRLVELLGSDDADTVFAAAYALLHRGDAGLAEKVLDAFAAAEDDVFHALAAALAYGPLPRAALDRVRAHLSDGPALRGVAAAEVLAFHGAPVLTGEQLRYFVEDDDVAARVAGWRLAALLGAQLPPRSYARAMRDPEPGVLAAAMEAGAWCGVHGVLPALRQLAEAPSPARLDALYLLAVLGTAEDAPRLYALAGDARLGSARFQLAGAYGDPRFIPMILHALQDPDPATAAAAGAAFARLTGVDVASGVRAAVAPADGTAPDAFDAEFLDEVALPDAAKARAEWGKLRPALEHATRLARGVEVAHAPGADAVARLDMQSRRELLLRERFHGRWTGTPLALERFPQARAAPDARPPA